jgi:hypothetical protein
LAGKLGSIDRTVVISALIALTGTVLTVLFSANFLSDILLNPSVYIQVINNGTTTVPKMIITNDGSQPADNLHIFIQTSTRMVSITNVFSTTNVSLVKPTQQSLERNTPAQVNSNFLEIFIPKLIHGIGSKVEVETLLDSQSAGYEVHAVYDQGSTMGSFTPNIVRDPFSLLYQFPAWQLTAIILGFIGSIGQFIAFFYEKRRNRRKNTQLVVNTIRHMRRLIMDDPTATRPLDMHLEDLQRDLANVFKNPPDYLIIDDFLSKLYKRQEMIENLRSRGTPIHPLDVGMINKEILDLAKKASEIDWKNYS